MSFFNKLEQRVIEIDSLLCVGLDPHLDDLPEQTAESAKSFCLNLIEHTTKSAAAFKPNSAFFEAFGADGVAALQQVIAAIPAGIPVILDAKRGDIASTALAYAHSVFDVMGAHAVTINPYLGFDAVQPFLSDEERGVFLLCKTSNPGAADIQDVLVAGDSNDDPIHLFERVASLARDWNTHDNLGLVVGATYPKALKRVRKIAPHLWILAPGVGTQGGELAQALQAGLRQDGMGMLIPISRGISRAVDPAQAAETIRQNINEERRKIYPHAKTEGNTGSRAVVDVDFEKLADGLFEAGCIKFGQFTLKSGLISPIYIDLRQLVSFPSLLDQVAHAYIPLLGKLSFKRLAGLPYAALPIATAISIIGGWPFIYPRKETKSYGTKADIEGLYEQGEQVVVIDDLATTGGSKFEAIEKLSNSGLIVNDVVVLIDRQSGAAEVLSKAGYHLHAVMTMTKLLDYYAASGKVAQKDIKAARDFISSSA